jgi:hypothetical protein
MYYYYGRALTLHVAENAQLFGGAGNDAAPAAGGGNEDEDEEEDDDAHGQAAPGSANGSVAAPAAAESQPTAASKDEDEVGAEEDEDEQDPGEVDDKQVAWEALETARLILAGQAGVPAMERLADVYGTLADLAIESGTRGRRPIAHTLPGAASNTGRLCAAETFEVAVREYTSCLELQQRLYEPVSRLIAETYPPPQAEDVGALWGCVRGHSLTAMVPRMYAVQARAGSGGAAAI